MNRFSEIFSVVSAILALFTVKEFHYMWYNFSNNLFATFVLGTLAIVQILVALGLVVFATLPVSDLHTARSALQHFATLIISSFIITLRFRKADQATKEVRKVQRELLLKILRENASTEFGRKFSFANIKTVEEYQKAVPLTTYEDYRSYADRIEKGEQNLLVADKIIKLCVSAGTTGKSKLLPFNESLVKFYAMELFVPIICRQTQREMFTIAPVKTFFIEYVPKWRYATCGLPIGPASAYPGKKPAFLTLGLTTPVDAMAYMTEPAQSYIHWLFALMDQNVKHIACGFGGTLLVNFQFFEKNWKQLAKDIRRGRITNTHNIPEEMVAKIEKMPIFKANPHRADAIEAACSKGFQGIASRLWPRLEGVFSVVTGAHAIYREHLKWYVGKSVRIVAPFYGASEAVFAAPMTFEQEDNYTYTLLARIAFMEFIPESDIGSTNPRVLLADELECDQRYEIVATSPGGFYRYRIGDIILVTGFYNQAPVIEFCSRIGGILDLRGEKTTEDMVIGALKAAVPKWKGCASLDDFTVTDSLTLEMSYLQNSDKKAMKTSGQLYYALFVELTGVTRPLTADEVAEFDKALSSITYPYQSFRGKDAISMPKIFVVPKGSFETLKRRFLESNQAVSNQFKMPRYLKQHEYIRFLVDSSFK